MSDSGPELEKYELLEELGHGGMATVYRARDRRLGRSVAVKIIHRHLRQNPEVARRFTSEARAVAKLKHVNIVEVYDVSGEDETERYLVVELVDGLTLRQLLSEDEKLPVEVGVALTFEVARALEHAHREGVIHRDIKPENVLLECKPLTADDERPYLLKVKLTDFGIAKVLDAQGVTSTGQVLGSPAHMAPEQIEGSAVDARADVFGLGVLLYECITGKLPFQGKNPAQVLRCVLDGVFESPEKVVPKVGSRWAAIVRQALGRRPEDRFASVAEFSAVLQRELVAFGIADSRKEIAHYLLDRKGYPARFEERIVEGLSRAGEAARAQGRIAEATAHFSRALAYRPGDANLLGRVRGIGRRERVRKILVAGLGAAILVGLFAVVALRTKPAVEEPLAGEVPAIPPAPVAEPERLESSNLDVVPVAKPLVSANVEPRRPLVRLKATGVSEPEADEVPVVERDVQVRISGAMGGSLRVDGKEQEWFGKTFKLAAGPHRFEFVPPDETCCRGSARSVEITAGEGVQVVRGQIGFKEATLRMSAAARDGATVSCPTIFNEDVRTPAERKISMAQAEVQARCTVKPTAEPSVPVQKVVTLRAGETTELAWP